MTILPWDSGYHTKIRLMHASVHLRVGVNHSAEPQRYVVNLPGSRYAWCTDGENTMIHSALQTGLSGMQHSYRNMTEAASQLVHSGLTGPGDDGTAATVDTATALVGMMAEEQIFTASAKVVSTSDRALGTLLDATA
jgi:4-hydroxy-3-methylbut-2-en-1-yl diphosphate synthase IspG/GcpE